MASQPTKNGQRHPVNDLWGSSVVPLQSGHLCVIIDVSTAKAVGRKGCAFPFPSQDRRIANFYFWLIG